ncbi:hypothetical protein [Roseomonas genomospecies 6]|uniref:Uncharacterized protein n=1 Tax=Roseomonas genomospecies 6 TaxID=214106 RepID=A0A9W7TXZ6_9PROT|nr:hypothetical protein [Roseomonas genomospecies 6]KAA0680329.1 hypothetical protein DS843_13525 [Roseomonas genomospecies 6]
MILEPISLAVALCLATFAATYIASVLNSVWDSHKDPGAILAPVRPWGRPANMNRAPRGARRHLWIAGEAPELKHRNERPE